MTALLILAALVSLGLVVTWVCKSVVRMAVAAVALAATHNAPPLPLVAGLAVLLAAFAAVIVARAVAETGGRLLIVGVTA